MWEVIYPKWAFEDSWKDPHWEQQFTCYKCEKVFTKCERWKRHERTHKREKPIGCSTCEKAYKTSVQSKDSKVHEIIHQGEMPFACSRNDKAFIHCKYFEIHERTHTKMKKIACSFCHKAFIAYHQSCNSNSGGICFFWKLSSWVSSWNPQCHRTF